MEPSFSPLQVQQLDQSFTDKAVSLVSRVWPQLADEFKGELRAALLMPEERFVFGIIRRGELASLAILCQESVNFCTWSISWLIVAPEFQRQGLGKQLVEQMCNFARQKQDKMQQISPNDCDCLIIASSVQSDFFLSCQFESVMQFGPRRERHFLLRRIEGSRP